MKINAEIEDVKREMLREYFKVEMKDNEVIKVPTVDHVKIADEEWMKFMEEMKIIKLENEEEVFKKIFNNLSEMLFRNVNNYENSFNKMKRVIIGTERCISQFQIITDLNVLYKMFERR